MPEKARYAVRESSAAASGKPLSLRATSLQLAEGTIIETRNCGPLSRGKKGVVVGWDAAELALRVQLEGGSEAGGGDGVVSLECESCRALAAGRQMDVAAAAAMSDSDFDSSANHISDEML